MKMTRKFALEKVGQLSHPSKMPCPAYGTPAKECNNGSKLRLIAGSVCEICYALKGRCAMQNAQTAQYRRLGIMKEAAKGPGRRRWIACMVFLIKREECFRWLDTGDIPDEKVFLMILAVCRLTPDTKHWIPTKEYALVKRWADYIPGNVVVRVSSPMIDQEPLAGFKNTSTVHMNEKPHGFVCRAPENDGHCGDCRECWNKRRKNISYHEH